jgi:hypothetical protein
LKISRAKEWLPRELRQAGIQGWNRDSAGHVIPHGPTEGYKIVPKT